MLYIITKIFKKYNLTFCFKMKSTSSNYIQISLRKIRPINTEKNKTTVLLRGWRKNKFCLKFRV